MSASDLVARLAQEGIDPTLLAEVAKELFSSEIERQALAQRRENDRNRQNKRRNVTQCHVTERDNTGRDVTPSSDKVSPQTPNQNNSFPSPPYSPPASLKRTPAKPESLSVEVWADFTAMRKRKRADVTPTVVAGIEREAGKAGVSLEDALREAVERGWSSFKADWLTNSQGKGPAPPPPTDFSRIAEQARLRRQAAN